MPLRLIILACIIPRVTQNKHKALELHELAATNGHAASCTIMASIYERGDRRPQDLSRAFELYQYGASQGEAGACYNLGLWYMHGINGIRQDCTRAIRCWEACIECVNKRSSQLTDSGGHDMARAQLNLGIAYETGQGVTRNMQRAIELYTQAADQAQGTI